MITLVLITCLVKAQGKIDVMVTNVKNAKGSVRVGLFNNDKDYYMASFPTY